MNFPEQARPVRFKFAITTWGTALRNCRIDPRVDLSYKEMSDRVGVSKGLIKAWENGEGYPNVTQLKRLYASLRGLKLFENLLPKAQQDAIAAERVEVVVVFEDDTVGTRPSAPPAAPSPPPAPPQEIDEPRTFPAALRLLRQLEGLMQTEVAELLLVTGSVISDWELGKTTPIQDHYDKLVALMPALEDAPRPPGIRSGMKPGFAPGARLVPPPFVPRGPDRSQIPRDPVRTDDVPSSNIPTADSPPLARPPGERPVTVSLFEPIGRLEAQGIAYARALREVSVCESELETARGRVKEMEARFESLKKMVDEERTALLRLAEGTTS